jgi:hypothetical protein
MSSPGTRGRALSVFQHFSWSALQPASFLLSLRELHARFGGRAAHPVHQRGRRGIRGSVGAPLSIVHRPVCELECRVCTGCPMAEHGPFNTRVTLIPCREEMAWRT